jgi:ribose transport system permease protein
MNTATQTADAAAATSPSRPRPPLRRILSNGAVIIGLVYLTLYGIYALNEPSALTVYSFSSLMNNAAPLALAAAGVTLVILSRGFDLSVAGVISLTNVLMAVHPMEGPVGGLASLALCLVLGGAIGAINGILVSYVKLQSIASTLGVMIVCQGAALLILDAPGGYVSDWISYGLTDVALEVLPISGLILLLVACLWGLFLRTDLAVGIYAVGADENAALLSGVRVRRVRLVAYILAGALYGFAGYMLSAQTATGNPNAGEPFILLAFAAAAIGGTSFAGGQGGIIGSMIGAATLMLLQKVLFSAGVSSFYTGLFQGVILISAILFSGLLTTISNKGRAR